MNKVKEELIIVDEKSIKDKIYIVRGQKVMIDSDLAKIYGYTTKAFNQQVKRNIGKFDEDFMFQLNDFEVKKLSRSQNVTLKNGSGHNIKYNPYAFTEQGIYILMTVLKGELAVKQSKALIRLFKEMKDYIIDNNNFIDVRDFMKLSIQTVENTNSIKRIEQNMATKDDLLNIMDNFIIPEKYREFLILNGESVEADLAYNNIYNLAKNTIYIIDNYISLKTLVLLKNINKSVKVIIFSDNVNKGIHKQELDDFRSEYPNIDITFMKSSGIIHDRYIVLDYNNNTEKIYHCGTSSKDSGKRINTIIEINDRDNYHLIINKLLNNNELVI